MEFDFKGIQSGCGLLLHVIKENGSNRREKGERKRERERERER